MEKVVWRIVKWLQEDSKCLAKTGVLLENALHSVSGEFKPGVSASLGHIHELDREVCLYECEHIIFLVGCLKVSEDSPLQSRLVEIPPLGNKPRQKQNLLVVCISTFAGHWSFILLNLISWESSIKDAFNKLL